MSREPVTVQRIVATARGLLVRGGLEAVTVREVARALGVSAPALYKHLQGRAEIVDRLAAACLAELTEAVVAARDGVPADDAGVHVVRLRAASGALRDWARAHPAEFALLFATPAAPFAKVEDGVGQAAGRQLGRAFLDLLVAAVPAGRLRAAPDAGVPPGTAQQLRAWAAARELPLSDGQLWTAVAGFQDLLGLVMVDVFGQLGFALGDTSAYMDDRLDRFARRLLAGGADGADEPARAGSEAG